MTAAASGPWPMTSPTTRPVLSSGSGTTLYQSPPMRWPEVGTHRPRSPAWTAPAAWPPAGRAAARWRWTAAASGSARWRCPPRPGRPGGRRPRRRSRRTPACPGAGEHQEPDRFAGRSSGPRGRSCNPPGPPAAHPDLLEALAIGPPEDDRRPGVDAAGIRRFRVERDHSPGREQPPRRPAAPRWRSWCPACAPPAIGRGVAARAPGRFGPAEQLLKDEHAGPVGEPGDGGGQDQPGDLGQVGAGAQQEFRRAREARRHRDGPISPPACTSGLSVTDTSASAAPAARAAPWPARRRPA